MPLLELDITLTLGEFTLEAELTAEEGPLVIIGPSGAGKTLILRQVAGILRPDRGRIVANGRVLFDSEQRIDTPAQERNVGYVPQEYALFPHLTVAENIRYGLRGKGAAARARTAEMLDLVGLVDQQHLHPRELSGGQRQRVALARALAVKPDLLLLDEPFAALDAPTRESLPEEVRRLVETTATPMISVTHDRTEALRIANTIAVLIDGHIRQVGAPPEVFGAPASEEVAAFVGVETIVAGEVVSVDDGVPLTEVAGHRIQGGSGVAAGDDVLLCIRPEDVVLSPAPSASSSARNHLPARVTGIVPSGPYLRVQLDAGFPVVSLITRNAAEDLSVAPGADLAVSFKASAVHLIRRS
jgi:molybdate transport system ATP-binding protein